jgi:thioredoxin 2
MIQTCPHCGKANRLPASRLNARARCGACKEPLLPLDAPVPVPSATEFDEIVRESPLPVLVDFWANWCGPCHMVAPEIEKLARTHAGSAVVLKLDTDAVPDVAAKFGIGSIPTFVVFRGGREAKRASGAMSAEDIASAVSL